MEQRPNVYLSLRPRLSACRLPLRLPICSISTDCHSQRTFFLACQCLPEAHGERDGRREMETYRDRDRGSTRHLAKHVGHTGTDCLLARLRHINNISHSHSHCVRQTCSYRPYSPGLLQRGITIDRYTIWHLNDEDVDKEMSVTEMNAFRIRTKVRSYTYDRYVIFSDNVYVGTLLCL